MIGFSYNYKSHTEVFESLTKIGDLPLIDMMLLGGIVSFFVFCSFFIFPASIIWYKHHNSKKEKLNKKKILTQILLKKEIEDEVEREIQIDDEKKVIV